MNEFQKATEEMEAYYTDEYSTDDLKAIADYFGRPIAAAIYKRKVTDEVKAEMKRIFLKKENGEYLKIGSPKEVIKAIRKEI